MGLVSAFDNGKVKGWRVGRFPVGINTTCYFFQVDDVLIDTGPPNQWKIVQEILRHQPFQQVLVTHHHEDHGGNARAIQQRFHTPVFASRQTVQILASGFPMEYFRKWVWGVPAPARLTEFPATITTSRGLTIKPVPTPGHAPDMVCFWIPEEGWLFTGDLFITPRPRYGRQDEDPRMEMASLQSILQLDFQTIFCAHRGMVLQGYRMLKEKLEHWQELADKVQQLKKQGIPMGQVRDRLLGREGFLSWFTAFHFSKRNLIQAFWEMDESFHKNGES